jgi:hypothetical protein
MNARFPDGTLRGGATRRVNTARAMLAILVGATTGCVGRPATLGAIESEGASASGSAGEGEASGSSSGGDESPASSSGDESGSDSGAVACEGANVGDGIERLLDDQQYANTIRDLFGIAYAFPVASEGDPFPTAWTADPGPTYEAAASDVASLVDVAALASCSLDATGAEADACVEAFVDDMGRRAFRHTLSADERNDVLAGAIGADVEARLRGAVETMLGHSSFTRPAVEGAPAADGAGLLELDAWSLAHRLSYFVWNSTPDDELLAAAESGALLDDAELLAQTQRLLADPRARTMQGDLYDYLLGTKRLVTETKHESMIPPWSAELAAQMLVEQRRFVGDVTTTGNLADLLTATHTFANADIAAVYGDELAGAAPAGAAFERVELDAHRKGVLTRLAFLSAHTTASEIATPTRRGKQLLEAFFCFDIPPPPPDVDIEPPDEPPPADFREMWEQAHLDDPTCATCHAVVDGPGWAFGNYDPIGRWVDEINGFPVDPHGELPNDAAFADLEELADVLSNDDEVAACVAQRYYEFAVRRELDERDQCTLEELATGFTASGKSFRELVLAIVQSRAFRLARP